MVENPTEITEITEITETEIWIHFFSVHSAVISVSVDSLTHDPVTLKTARFFEERQTRTFPPDIQRVALRKLAQLHAVTELSHLSVPPGNRLEGLRGTRQVSAQRMGV